MKNKKNNSHSGFVALMSAIVIAAVLLVLATTASLAGWYTRANILDDEYKQRSSTIALACEDEAMLSFAKDPTFAGNATSTVGSDACYVGAVQTNGLQKTFEVQAQYQHFYTNLFVTINPATFSIISTIEKPVF